MNDTPDSTLSAIGPWLRFDVALRSGGLWLGPVWGVVCGVIASGRFTWNARGLLLAGLTLFLVDGLWATLQAAMLETNWAASVARRTTGSSPLRSHLLAHLRSEPRAVRWLSQLVQGWQTKVSPALGPTVTTIPLCLMLGTALAAILGWQMLALSAAALAVIQIGLVLNRATGQAVPVVKAALEMGLAWLAGHAAFGSPGVLSALMAAIFTLTYLGGLHLVARPGGGRSWYGTQGLAALLLFLVRQPVAAWLLVILLFAQLLTAPLLQQEHPGIAFVRSNQAWMIAAMLAAAFAV